MLNKDRQKLLSVVVIIIVIFVWNFYGISYLTIPVVKAASLESTKDILSDSSFNASSSHTIIFNLGDSNWLTDGDKIQLAFDPDFSNLNKASALCPADSVASTTYTASTYAVDCTVTGFLEATTTHTIVVYNINNPDTPGGTQDISITSLSASNSIIERTDMKVTIVSNITVTANVENILSYTVSDVGAGELINGVLTTGTSTADTINFGTLNPSASSTLGQAFSVSTNAPNGFVVTVQQTQELTNESLNTINSFNNSPDNSGSTTPQAWVKPKGIVNQYNTYGHMGVTSEYSDYSNSKYAGINGIEPLIIMSFDGPADGETQGIGLVKVAYTIEINALQEQGTYTNALTYICTPAY